MDLSQITKPLEISEIDFRVQSVTKNGYVIILAYKNARVDQNRLDKAFGVLGWQREHTNNNHNCIVSLWDDKNKHWVRKEDVGTESFSDKEKGLASDSFKRACFNIGIGRELYDYPFICFKLNPEEFTEYNGKPKTTNKFRLSDWKFHSEFTIGGELIFLGARDTSDNLRWKWKHKDYNKLKGGKNGK